MKIVLIGPVYFDATNILVLRYEDAMQGVIGQIAYNCIKLCLVTADGGLSRVVIGEKTGYVVQL